MEYQHGGDIYSQEVDLDFSANLNPFGLPEAVRRAAADSLGDCLSGQQQPEADGGPGRVSRRAAGAGDLRKRGRGPDLRAGAGA